MLKDRLISETDAVKRMQEIGVDAPGIRIMRDKSIFRIIYLVKVKPAIANIIKETMLSAGGDAAVNKLACACKVRYTDMILMGTKAQYKYLLKRLKFQPYNAKNIIGRIKNLLVD